MRVYITGMGVVSSLGNDVGTLFQALEQGKSGIRQFPEWEKYNGLHTYLGAPAPAYDIHRVSRTARRTMSRMSEMATLATFEALHQAHFDIHPGEPSPRTLICMGSTTGSPDALEQYFKKVFERGGPEGQLGTGFFRVMNHSVPANVASALGFHGAVTSVSSACATSSHAIITGWELIQAGLYDVVIAGGADELHYSSAAIFDIVMAASRGFNDRPDEASRPFDLQRDGLVVSEGAAVVVMESEQSARNRGAKMLAEVLGGAYLCNGSHMSQSNAPMMAETMKTALERSRIKPCDIGYVNAHATSTVQGDAEEAQAIGAVFGPEMPVSSLKGHLGHSLAACGSLEAIACVKMMERGVLIGTRNLKKIDPACSGVKHLRENQSVQVKTILSNNFAFGGINTSLVLSTDKKRE